MENKLNLITKTKNYKQFKKLPYNRDESPTHVKQLVLSIQDHNDLHLFPIIVTPEFEIIDGQHRLLAAKELDLEIYYVIDTEYNIQKITTFNNNQKRWVAEDHLKKFAELGNDNYIKLIDLMKDVNFSLPNILIWLCENTTRLNINFRNGHFKFNLDEKKFDIIFKAKKLISIFKKNNFRPISIYNQTFFHSALKKMLTNQFVDFDRFYNSISNNFHLVKFCRSSYEYAEMFCDIYNHNKRTDRLKTQKDKNDYDFVM